MLPIQPGSPCFHRAEPKSAGFHATDEDMTSPYTCITKMEMCEN